MRLLDHPLAGTRLERQHPLLFELKPMFLRISPPSLSHQEHISRRWPPNCGRNSAALLVSSRPSATRPKVDSIIETARVAFFGKQSALAQTAPCRHAGRLASLVRAGRHGSTREARHQQCPVTFKTSYSSMAFDPPSSAQSKGTDTYARCRTTFEHARWAATTTSLALRAFVTPRSLLTHPV